jgi:hypothetical protein
MFEIEKPFKRIVDFSKLVKIGNNSFIYAVLHIDSFLHAIFSELSLVCLLLLIELLLHLIKFGFY